ncbi:uncharacterized protein [Antedon mediterranea]|uniref:uncharacterized protein n=1 Tax=Antedon mediterranea TaxID=105859 RepID=UPI003AF9E020
MTCRDSWPVFGIFAAIIGVVASAAVITIFGITVVTPYMLTREFQPADCIVESVERLNTTRECKCNYEGRRCDVISSLCVVVSVRSFYNFETGFGILFASDQSLSFDHKCSYPTCWSYSDYNSTTKSYEISEELEDFLETYQPGANVSCFIDTTEQEPRRALGVKHISKQDVFHSLVWPLSVLFLGIFCATCSLTQLQCWEAKHHYRLLSVRRKSAKMNIYQNVQMNLEMSKTE